MRRKKQPLHSAASWFPANNPGPGAQQVPYWYWGTHSEFEDNSKLSRTVDNTRGKGCHPGGSSQS